MSQLKCLLKLCILDMSQLKFSLKSETTFRWGAGPLDPLLATPLIKLEAALFVFAGFLVQHGLKSVAGRKLLLFFEWEEENISICLEKEGSI